MLPPPSLFENFGRKLYPKDNLSGDVKLFSNTGNLLKEAMQYAHQMSGNYYVYKSCYLFSIVYEKYSGDKTSDELLAFTTPLFMPHRSTEVPGESNVSYRKDDYPKGHKTVVSILKVLKVDGILEEVVKARSKHGNTSVDGLIKQFERYLFINNGKKLSTAEETVTIGDILDYTLHVKRVDINLDKSISISCTKRDDPKSTWQIANDKEPRDSVDETYILSAIYSITQSTFIDKPDPERNILLGHIIDTKKLVSNLWIYIKKIIMATIQDDLSNMDDNSFKLFLDNLFAHLKIIFDLINIYIMLPEKDGIAKYKKPEIFCRIDEEEHKESYHGPIKTISDTIYFYFCKNLVQRDKDVEHLDKNMEFSRNIYYHFVIDDLSKTNPEYLKKSEEYRMQKEKKEREKKKREKGERRYMKEKAYF